MWLVPTNLPYTRTHYSYLTRKLKLPHSLHLIFSIVPFSCILYKCMVKILLDKKLNHDHISIKLTSHQQFIIGWHCHVFYGEIIIFLCAPHQNTFPKILMQHFRKFLFIVPEINATQISYMVRITIYYRYSVNKKFKIWI